MKFYDLFMAITFYRTRIAGLQDQNCWFTGPELLVRIQIFCVYEKSSVVLSFHR